MPPSALNVYLLTSNCARELVNTSTFSAAFFNAVQDSEGLPDIVAISLQEIAPIAQSFLGGGHLLPYFSRVEESLHAAALSRGGEKEYELLHTENVGMTALMVFVTRQVAERVLWMQRSVVGVGLWEMGTKGAAALRVSLSAHGDANGGVEQVVLTFVAAHLTHKEEAYQRRNQDWATIVRNLVFTSKISPSADRARKRHPQEREAEPLLSYCEGDSSSTPMGLYTTPSTVFFFGDLNYRTRDQAPLATEYITFPQPVSDISDPRHLSQWLACDQLNREREAGKVLQHFHEEKITFAPTYKYAKTFHQAREVMQSGFEPARYTWASHRAPSWCDRILFWSSPPSHGSSQDITISPYKYDALPIQPHSDHRPVALSARITFSPRTSASEASEPAPFDAAPYPINPKWASVRAAARRREVAVGAAAWSVLTTEGRLCVFLPIALVVVGYLVLSGR